MRALLPLLLIAAVGCAGSVRIDSDEVDSFGPGTSAAYVVLDLDGDTYHFFLLANRVGICGKLDTAYQEAFAATQDWDGSLEDGDCDDYTAALADAWDPVLSGSAHFLAISLNNGFDFSLDEITEPDEDTYDIGQGEASLLVSYYPSGESPYREVADREDGCDLDDALDDGRDAITSYSGTDGDIVLEEGSNGSWRLDFEVEIDDEDGDSAGDLSGGFGAAPCDIELDDLGGLALGTNPYAYSPWSL
jgi:hypothetical protein